LFSPLKFLVVLGALGAQGLAYGGTTPTESPEFPEQSPGVDEADDLERIALGILEQRCFECHGPELSRGKGGVKLDGRHALLEGGASGPALDADLLSRGVGGDGHLLVRMLRWEEEYLEMPPKEPLPQAELDVLERWVAAGAPWTAAVSEPEHSEATSESNWTSAEQAFVDEVLPILSRRCFHCHGPEVARPRSGFSMAGRLHFIDGGTRGPAIVPGDTAAGVLLPALRHTGELAMPPSGPLPADEFDAIQRWIENGAAWPEGLHASAFDPSTQTPRHFLPAPVAQVPLGTSAGAGAAPIDAFVARKLDQAGLSAAPEAAPSELLRRVTLDLTGLPPTRDALIAFDEEPTRENYAAYVDELLASPAYGERLARLWLDVVRYAESDGFERDATKPLAWKYRDWVIDAFRSDLGYDRFLRAQLAGDEQPDAAPNALAATGFWRLHAWDNEPNDPVQAEFDELDDDLRTITEGLLGVTVGCARCHDHRFDPITQRDYYGLLAYLRNVERYVPGEYRLGNPILRPMGASEADLAAWNAERDAALVDVRSSYHRALLPYLEELARKAAPGRVDEALEFYAGLAELPLPEARRLAKREGLGYDYEALRIAPFAEKMQLVEIMDQLEHPETFQYRGDLDWVLAVRERDGVPLATYLFGRGQASAPLGEVDAGTPAAIGLASPEPWADAETSRGSRSALADWIADEDNPLTARVWANRLWQLCFGTGLVSTPNDFGNAGEPASHPQLLDHLAAELVAGDWSTKALLRKIVLSDTYRRSSRWRDPEAETQDPDARLLWRQSPRRLQSEMLHDALLAATGELSLAVGGPSVHPRVDRRALAGQSRPARGWRPLEADGDDRRSIYTSIRRGVELPLHQLFDRPPAVLPSGRRSVTTTATQALHLLNGEFSGERAGVLAQELRRQCGDDLALAVERLFERVLLRPPTQAEAELGLRHLTSLAGAPAAAPALVFAPRVPTRVDTGFLDLAAAVDLLAINAPGWRPEQGNWGNLYNGTLAGETPDGLRGVLDGLSADDVSVTAAFEASGDLAGFALLLRMSERADALEALVVNFDLERGRLTIEERGPEPKLLHRAPVELENDTRHDLRVRLLGDQLSVEVAGQQVRLNGLARRQAGQLGVALHGGELEFAQFDVRVGQEVTSALPESADPVQQALESLALVLFNSNEFVWVD
jgi:hypothetical protein